MGWQRRKADRIHAVSYTHLDVYKRQLYNSLWEKADLYAVENLKGEELDYFYEVTD